MQWTNRQLAYALFAAVLWWAGRAKRGGPWGVVAVVALQVVVAAAMVLLARPPALQAAHAAVGTAALAGLVGAVRGSGNVPLPPSACAAVAAPPALSLAAGPCPRPPACAC